MDDPRFYYFTPGGEVLGPVSMAGLRRLYYDRVIGPESLLCPEGQTEWQPLNLEDFQDIDPAPTFIPEAPRTPRRKSKNRSPSLLPRNTAARQVLKVSCYVISIGAAFVLTTLAPTLTPNQAIHDQITWEIGGFCVALLLLLGLPWLLTLIVPRPYQLLVRTFVIASLSVISIALLIAQNSTARQLVTTIESIDPTNKQQPQIQIANNGKIATDHERVNQDIQTIKDQLSTDTSDSARMTRDFLTVVQTMSAKAKASDDAENSCKLDTADITSHDDLARRRQQFDATREIEANMLAYLLNLDDNLRQSVTHENFSPTVVDTNITSFRQAGRYDIATQLWQARLKLIDDYRARLTLLDQSWGHWNAKDKQLIFEDKTALESYNQDTLAIQADAKHLIDLQKLLYK